MNAARTQTIFSTIFRHRRDLSFTDLLLRPRRSPDEHNLFPLLGTTPRARRSWSSQWLGFGLPEIALDDSATWVASRVYERAGEVRTGTMPHAATRSSSVSMMEMEFLCSILIIRRRSNGIIDFRRFPLFSFVGNYETKTGPLGRLTYQGSLSATTGRSCLSPKKSNFGAFPQIMMGSL